MDNDILCNISLQELICASDHEIQGPFFESKKYHTYLGIRFSISIKIRSLFKTYRNCIQMASLENFVPLIQVLCSNAMHRYENPNFRF